LSVKIFVPPPADDGSVYSWPIEVSRPRRDREVLTSHAGVSGPFGGM
jgi:hypothetical protein